MNNTMGEQQTLHLLQLGFLLIAGHALADFAFQTEWVATNKNRNIRLSFPPAERAKMQVIWPYLLTAHSFHHGLIVYLISQSFPLGLVETALHWVTDFGKCERWYGFHTDQIIHIGTKFLYVALIALKIVQ